MRLYIFIVAVLINRYADYYEQFNDDGECVISAKSDYSDELQEAYAKFSQLSDGLQVNFGHFSVSANQWQFIELQGRTKSQTQQSSALDNLDDWYDNVQYIYSERCPHYKNRMCSVLALAESDSG